MVPRPVISASNIIVVMPNWLGDGVMATPFLRALRESYPEASIDLVVKPLVRAVAEGLVESDRWRGNIIVCGKGEEGAVAKQIRGEAYDLGVLLPNSFRSAWMLWRGGVKRRLGYARGGRSLLLTDRVKALPRSKTQKAADARKAEAIAAAGGGRVAVGSAYEPVPTIEYYLKLAEYLGADSDRLNLQMELAIAARERAEAEDLLKGVPLGGGLSEYVVLVPGANFGSSKCWPAERFGELAVALANVGTAWVLIAASPAEESLVKEIVKHAMTEDGTTHNLVMPLSGLAGARGTSPGALKEIVRRSSLMVCNDTGPRHFAAAFGVPTVTLFGPTDPRWAEAFTAHEKIVRVEVPCGPCQLKKCPIDHRCMKGITVEMVMAQVREMWPAARKAALAVEETPG